ncbi:hypothetical protein ACOMHN_025713 [Nucella lapillus]
MARLTLTSLLLLLLLTTSLLQHVTSFAIHKRHSRSTDLGDALRMLERQRRRFGGDDEILDSNPQLLSNRPLTMADLEPWFNTPQTSPPEETIDAAWLAKTLGLDGYNNGEGGRSRISKKIPTTPSALSPHPLRSKSNPRIKS